MTADRRTVCVTQGALRRAVRVLAAAVLAAGALAPAGAAAAAPVQGPAAPGAVQAASISRPTVVDVRRLPSVLAGGPHGGGIPERPRDAAALALAKAATGHGRHVGVRRLLGAGQGPTSGGTGATGGTAAVSGGLALMTLDQQVSLLGSSETLTPPDTQLAAGPTYLMEVDNATGSIWTKSGTLVSAFNLNSFFGVPAQDAGYGAFDPRVVYDAGSGRWIATVSAADPTLTYDQVFVAVSATSDPTGSWYVYTLAANASGELYDQPMTGVNSNLIVVSWNDFAYGGTSFVGQETWVVQKSDMLAGGSAAVYRWGPDPTRFRLVPAVEDGSNPVEYLTYNNADAANAVQTQGYPSVGVVEISGTPAQGDVAVSEYDPQIAATSVPPPASQPGTTTVDTGDDRFQSAIWSGGVLWTSGNDACVPPGSSTVQSCMRLVEIGTGGGAPTVLQDFDAGSAGTDLYYPAVALDGNGNLVVAYTQSSASQAPSAAAAYQPAGTSGALQGATVFASGQAAYCGVDCQAGGGNRWGDYSAASVDPSNPSQVWVAAEYAATATDQGNWGTAAAAVTVPTTASGPVVTAVSPQLGPPAGGTAVTIAGTGFTGATSVDFGANAAAITSVTSTAIAAIAPAGTPGTVDVTVTTPDGTSSAGTGSTFTYTAPLAVTTKSLAGAIAGTPYSADLQAQGGSAPDTWSVANGALPPGLGLSSSGSISGTPTQAGTFGFTVAAADSESPAQNAQQALSITVSAALTIVTASLPGGIEGTGYSAQLQSTGGTAPLTWSLISGALPPGLSLSASTGFISGTPTQTGAFSFTAQVVDAGSPQQTVTQPLTISVTAPLVIQTTTLPPAIVGATYSQSLQAGGGAAPYQWSVASGALPPGLALNAATGVISGTPTTAGSYDFTIGARDSGSPAQTAAQALALTVAPPPLVILTTSLPSGTRGKAYSVSLAASGGTTPYTWAIGGGSLPPGLSLNPSTGTISGTPTGFGQFTFSVSVTDCSQPAETASQSLSITVAKGHGR